MILKNGKRIDGCSDTVPVGTLNPFLGLTPPAGYLICQGQLVSKQLYPELYAICGDTFGTATATEFYLPDLRGKTITGYKEGDSTFGTLGALIGNLSHTHNTGNHTLTTSEMPKHYHLSTYWNGPDGIPVCMSYTSGSNAGYDLSWSSVTMGNARSNLSTSYAGEDGAHNHGNTSSASSLQPSINLNWIVKSVMLIPVNSIVENSLTSTSTTNALSAAQGKVLNDRFSNLATVAISGSYNDLSNKPTIPSVINNLTSTSTTSALSAKQGKILNDKITLVGSYAIYGSPEDPQTWTGVSSWDRMPYSTLISSGGSTIMKTNNNGLFTVGANIHRIKITATITYDTTLSSSEFLFVRIAHNNTAKAKQIAQLKRWDQLRIEWIADVAENDTIQVQVYKDVSGTISFYNYLTNFGAGTANYIMFEVLA